MMNVGLFAVVSRIFGLDLSMTEGAALIVAFATGAALPSAPGYVGALEAAGVVLLSAAGIRVHPYKTGGHPFLEPVHILR